MNILYSYSIIKITAIKQSNCITFAITRQPHIESNCITFAITHPNGKIPKSAFMHLNHMKILSTYFYFKSVLTANKLPYWTSLSFSSTFLSSKL